ncbi:5'-nucleotidase C-terminal domain-containing protein [Flavobacteriaceae bacterium]|nr:5'-nucleotidase C-terminal domain-containing protein [Flavobacteriaceae bacterium]
MMNKIVLMIGFLSLVLSCDNSKKLVTTGAQNISINKEIEAVKEIEDIIAPYKVNLDKTMNEVLSFSVDTYSKNNGDYNTAVGNMMADAVFELTSPLFRNRTGKNIDMVLLNHGGIRANLPKGNITTKTAYSLMPFENSVVVTALKGSVILEMTNYLRSFKKAHPISGLELVLNADNSYRKILVGGKSVESEKTYYVATNDYLYKGGDRMDFFKKSDTLYDLNYKIRNVLLDYFSKNDTLSPTIDQRFIKLNN